MHNMETWRSTLFWLITEEQQLACRQLCLVLDLAQASSSFALAVLRWDQPPSSWLAASEVKQLQVIADKFAVIPELALEFAAVVALDIIVVRTEVESGWLQQFVVVGSSLFQARTWQSEWRPTLMMLLSVRSLQSDVEPCTDSKFRKHGWV